MSKPIVDFMFNSGDFADFIKVDSDGQDSRHRVKILRREAETYEVWYLVSAPTEALERAGLETFKDIDNLYHIPNHWSLSIVDADELESTEFQSFIKIV